MNKTILVVEDEIDIREAISETLTDAGFTVLTAGNGKEGLEKAILEQPDLILLDIVMPEMDGHETLEKLRADPWGLTAKVIMLTSMDGVMNVAQAHEQSISDYIIKSHHSLDEIVKKVKIALVS